MIYVFQPAVGGPVKIGCSKDGRRGVGRRFADLEPGCPWPLVIVCTLEGGHYEEGQLHERFKDKRIHREWFRLDGELVLWLRGIAGDKVGPAWPVPPEEKVIPLRRKTA